MSEDGYSLWCLERGVSHAHCPLLCEHPQPFDADGVLWCGRCWFLCGTRTEMVACTPEVCREGVVT